MRTSTASYLAAAVAVIGAACDANVVDLGVALDDGGSGASVEDATTVNEAASDTSSPPDARSVDSPPETGGPPFMHHDAAVPMCTTCVAVMGACGSTMDCCEGDRCVNGTCVPPPQVCSEEGTSCGQQPVSSCCSGRCEPTGPNGSAVCAPYCKPDNSMCSSAAECCSLACNGNACGGVICSTVGSVCQSDSDCCTGDCTGGHCVLTPSASCLPSGDTCGDGGAVGCCSNVCNIETQRCGVLGAVGAYGTVVLAPGSPCSHNGFSSCPDGETCSYSMAAHVLTCQAQGPQGTCTPDWQRSVQIGDCCSKTWGSGVCGTSCQQF